MELRQYLAVLWRRWPVIALVIGLSALASAVIFLRTPPAYTAAVRMLVRQEPAPANPPYFNYDRYYNWLANEFLSDDYTLIVTTRAFAQRVVEKLHANPVVTDTTGTVVTDPATGKPTHRYGEIDFSGLTAEQVLGTLSADRKHRILTLTAQTSVYGEASAFAMAAADVLTDQTLSHGAAPALTQVQIQDNAEFGLLDTADANSTRSNRTRSLLNAGIGLALGIVAALALAFLVEYLDTRLRDESDAERLLGVPVLGAIPRRQ